MPRDQFKLRIVEYTGGKLGDDGLRRLRVPEQRLRDDFSGVITSVPIVPPRRESDKSRFVVPASEANKKLVARVVVVCNGYGRHRIPCVSKPLQDL
ncbi:hypothetical protein IF188_19200 [Microbacterium sp. NEAU-LLC]|uniref:Uncharacterized protein n=1 Tax=Microbacterium helvum TaxID=2773713 RepID=A0ABR8NT87_9MICO|nr:hypothetical protein [Microbacterium helvum]MBD3943825.1 hypothetical protein [Microbacterium helvum]